MAKVKNKKFFDQPVNETFNQSINENFTINLSQNYDRNFKIFNFCKVKLSFLRLYLLPFNHCKKIVPRKNTPLKKIESL